MLTESFCSSRNVNRDVVCLRKDVRTRCAACDINRNAQAYFNTQAENRTELLNEPVSMLANPYFRVQG